MVTALKTVLDHSLAPKLFIKIKPQTISQIRSNRSFSDALYPSFSCNGYYPLVEMSQRTSFIFHCLNVLKQSPIDPVITSCTHSLALKTSSLSDISIRTSLLTAYARSHDLCSSLLLFNEAVSTRDLISWNAMISACVLNLQFDVAVHLFREMVDGFGELDSTTLVIMLSGLSRTRNLKYGLVLHCVILKKRFELDVYLCNALIDMYAKCRELSLSEFVFEEIEVKDVTSWNSVVSGCLYNNCPIRSVSYYQEMSCLNVQPDQVSLSCVISACSCLKDLLDFGESVHACAIKLGYEGISHSSVDNSLISFYSSCGYVESAEKVFQRTFLKNTVSWNSMIKCYLDNGRKDDGLHLFRAMQSTPKFQPDAITLLTIIPVCSELNLLHQEHAH